MPKQIWIGILLCGLLLTCAIFFACSMSPSATLPGKEKAPPNTEKDPLHPTTSPTLPPFVFNGYAFIGTGSSVIPGKQRRINTLLRTRRGDTVYQASIRYEPQLVSVTDVPDLAELVKVLAAQGKQLPAQIARVDEETEMILMNLGESLRSVMSYHSYVNPFDGHVLAYDLAQSNGGQAQHFIGRLSKDGVYVVSQRGSQYLENRDVPFATKNTFIPVEVELLVHQLYKANKSTLKPGQPIRFSIFIPGFICTVLVMARPLPDEVLSVGAATYECSRYEVQAISAQATDNTRAVQHMWFDKRSGFLMKRLDIAPGSNAHEAPVTERSPVDTLDTTLSQLRPLTVIPPALPQGTFPYPLNSEMFYTIKNKDMKIGTLTLSFSDAPLGSPGVFMSKAHVVMDTGTSSRHESALTYFDQNWQSVSYDTEGEEVTDLKSVYHISAHTQGETIQLKLARKFEERPATDSSASEGPAATEKLPSVVNVVNETAWKDPLIRVPVSDEEAQSQSLEQEVDKTRILTRDYDRVFMKGTYMYDFNRVEHLAAFAFRLPLPDIAAAATKLKPSTEDKTSAELKESLPLSLDAPKDAKETDQDKNPLTEDFNQRTYQGVGVVSIRQNRSGVTQFEIKPEPQPVLTDKQKRRMEKDPRNQKEPQLFIAQSTHPMLPCRMLLDPAGRILELKMRLGPNEIIYTLDDPIMHRREERARKQKLQEEGPRLLRPPWW